MGAPKMPGKSDDEIREENALRAQRKQLKAQELTERKELAGREVDQLKRLKSGFTIGRSGGSAPAPLTPEEDSAASPSSLFNTTTPF